MLFYDLTPRTRVYRRTRSILAATASMLTLVLSSGAFAQAAPVVAGQSTSETPSAISDQEVQDIVVTGIRASIASAQSIKRNADTIVDSIVAEDIGKFPDQNVVESLARVPGVQISRNQGEGTGVTIRGLSDVKTVLNGRELFGGDSNGNYSSRNFSLGDLPSEVLAGVDVYKTSDADQIEGGLGGYINVRTRRPFDFKGFAASLAAKATDYDRPRGFSNRVQPTVSGLISDRWETGIGEIGALVNVSYSKTSYTQDRSGIGDGVDVAVRPNYAGSGQSVTLPSTVFLNATQHGTHERLTVVGSLQWKPSSNLMLYFDGYYVRFKSKADFTDFRLNLGTETSTYSLFPNSSDLQSGTFLNNSVNSATAFGDNTRATQQYAVGGEWHNDNGLKVVLDISHTSTTNSASLEEWDLGVTVPTFTYATTSGGAAAYGASGVNLASAANYKPIYDLAIQAGGRQFANTARLDATYDIGGFLKSIAVGARLNEYVAQNEGYVNFFCINGGCGGGSQTGATIPSNFTTLFPSEVGNFVGFDPAATRQNTEIRNYFGLSPSLPNTNDQYLRDIEKTGTVYGKASFAVPLSGMMAIDGNIGVRYIHTWLTNHAFGTSPATPTVFDVLETTKTDRNDVLPTFNARLKFDADTWLRVGVGKSLERIPFNDLNGALVITNAAQLQAARGNPNLQPYTSWNYDLSLEHYFSRTASVYLAGFYKQVDGYLQSITLAGQTIPELTGLGTIATQVNAGKGTIKGVEVGAQTFFEFLPAPFDGFGVQANYTYVDSAVPSPVAGATDVSIQGLARHSYNLIGLFEKGPITARVAYAWRGKIVTNTAPADGAGGTSVYPNIGSAIGVMDFSLTYNVNERFAVTVDGANVLGYKDGGYVFGRSSLPIGQKLTDRRFGIQGRYKF